MNEAWGPGSSFPSDCLRETGNTVRTAEELTRHGENFDQRKTGDRKEPTDDKVLFLPLPTLIYGRIPLACLEDILRDQAQGCLILCSLTFPSLPLTLDALILRLPIKPQHKLCHDTFL